MVEVKFLKGPVAPGTTTKCPEEAYQWVPGTAQDKKLPRGTSRLADFLSHARTVGGLTMLSFFQRPSSLRGLGNGTLPIPSLIFSGGWFGPSRSGQRGPRRGARGPVPPTRTAAGAMPLCPTCETRCRPARAAAIGAPLGAAAGGRVTRRARRTSRSRRASCCRRPR